MTDSLQNFLEVALAAVKKAEPVFLKHFGKPPGLEQKVSEAGYRSPVTDIDKEIERVITSHLKTYFPKHSISGEELPERRQKSTYTWFIDPIDGTANYIRGLPFVSISVGLWKGERPLVGLVSDPINHIVYSAVRGAGAFKNKTEKLSVSSVTRLADGMGGVGRGSSLADDPALQRVARNLYRSREYGGAALELSAIAEGKLDFWISERTKIFDDAAGILILTEAGGRVTDWEGKQFKSDSLRIVASNGKIHEELLQTLKGK